MFILTYAARNAKEKRVILLLCLIKIRKKISFTDRVARAIIKYRRQQRALALALALALGAATIL